MSHIRVMPFQRSYLCTDLNKSLLLLLVNMGSGSNFVTIASMFETETEIKNGSSTNSYEFVQVTGQKEFQLPTIHKFTLNRTLPPHFTLHFEYPRDTMASWCGCFLTLKLRLILMATSGWEPLILVRVLVLVVVVVVVGIQT